MKHVEYRWEIPDFNWETAEGKYLITLSIATVNNRLIDFLFNAKNSRTFTASQRMNMNFMSNFALTKMHHQAMPPFSSV